MEESFARAVEDGLKLTKRRGHPARALVGALPHPQSRLRLPHRRAHGRSGAEVTVGKRSYNTHVIDVDDNSPAKIAKPESGGLLKQELFPLTIPQVGGGEDVFATIRWSQKLLYDNGQFSVEIPFRFPQFVNPLPKVFMKKEKIQLTVNSGVSKEVLLLGTSHPLKEKSRQGKKLLFLHEAVVENWSCKDFTFAYSVFRKAVVFIVDTSGSMQGKPIENVKNAMSTALSDLMQGDYFNIITFNDEVRSFSSCLEEVNEKAIENAVEWMNLNFVAQSGTDIMHPLSEAMALLSNSHDALPQIYLVTDGLLPQKPAIHQEAKKLHLDSNILGSYCNHYFLRMLASIGKKRCYPLFYTFDTGSIEGQMVQWFQRASSTIVMNISIDATKHIQEFEVDSEYIPDISAKYPLCLSGRYHGKLPETLVAKGLLADMSEISIELKVQHIKDIPLDKSIASCSMKLNPLSLAFYIKLGCTLFSKKSCEIKRIAFLPNTHMVLLQRNLDKIDPAQQAKKTPTKQSSPDELSRHHFAARENLTTGFGDIKAPEKFELFERAAGCCGRMADCCCCMCFIKACSKMNDQCATVLTQACAVLACLGCFECCSALCCGGSD